MSGISLARKITSFRLSENI